VCSDDNESICGRLIDHQVEFELGTEKIQATFSDDTVPHHRGDGTALQEVFLDRSFHLPGIIEIKLLLDINARSVRQL